MFDFEVQEIALLNFQWLTTIYTVHLLHWLVLNFLKIVLHNSFRLNLLYSS